MTSSIAVGILAFRVAALVASGCASRKTVAPLPFLALASALGADLFPLKAYWNLYDLVVQIRQQSRGVRGRATRR